MNRQQAQEVLLLYRPGTADAQDPEFTDALALARKDPELSRWLEEQIAMHHALQAKFRQIPVPEGLKEQILSERKAHTSLPLKRKLALAGVCAVCVVLLAVVAWPLVVPQEDKSFSNFQNRMVRTVARQGAYPLMDKETNDINAIRSYLTERRANGDYVLPSGLEKTTVTGCAILPWQGKTVSMLCFNSGKAVTPNSSDLFLFIINRADVPRAPEPGPPSFSKDKGLNIASWTHDGKTYILAGMDDEASLKKYF
jgi:hypothetical protein